MLPQAPEGAGYYTYGTPEKGGRQFTHPALMSVLLRVEREWQLVDRRKFGIGNISLPDGAVFDPHKGHRSGLDVDVRVLEKNGRQCKLTRFSPQYDRDGTQKLIELFWATGVVKVIYFNDLTISHVCQRKRHDDHFHVSLKG